MDDLNVYTVLKSLLTEEELSGLSGISIIQDGNGYVLFNKYRIQPNRSSKYTLTCFDTHLNKEFYSLRNAVMYATLDKRNKIIECNQILVLDKLLEGTEASIHLHSTLIKKTKNIDSLGLYQVKLIEDKNRKKQIIGQLNNYAKEVKKWQYKHFANASK